MNIKNSINIFRRSLMRGLTKNIGQSSFDKKGAVKYPIRRILISRPNHRLGNLILITPLLQEMINRFPESKIDLFIKGGAGNVIFKNYKNVDRLIQLPKKPFSSLGAYLSGWIKIRFTKYDLVINANEESSSGRLSTLFTKSRYKFLGKYSQETDLLYSDYRHIAKYPIYNFREFLKSIGFHVGYFEMPALNLKLSSKELKNGKQVLMNIVKNDKKTICLFTNASGEKCYSELWWGIFYEKIKTDFPDYNIIEMLPIENISRLKRKVPGYYSDDIREMTSVIAQCALFIGADSGVMHLAGASGTPTIGLFCVSDEIKYAPYGNKSMAVNTNELNNTEIISLIANVLA
jgi:heptosyltransferase-3